MDGAKEEGGKVIVIGTTSNPNKIDMALRRPGRLDREVHLPPPSTSQRLELLHLVRHLFLLLPNGYKAHRLQSSKAHRLAPLS